MKTYKYLTLIITICILNACNNHTANPVDPYPSGPEPNSNVPVEQPKSPEQIKQDLAAAEASEPLRYISQDGAWHKNLIGEWVIKGSIYSSATVARFKDIKFEVTFYSKTDTELGSRTFTVYEILNPGGQVNFKEKIFAPSNSAKQDTRIISATPIE